MTRGVMNALAPSKQQQVAPSAPDLPRKGGLGELAQYISADSITKLVAAVGGTLVYIPKLERLKDDHWLVSTIGRAEAEKLSREFGTQRFELPKGTHLRNYERVVAATLAGGSEATIASELNITPRTVRRIRAKARALGALE